MLGVRGFGFGVFEVRCFEVPGLGLVFRGSGFGVTCGVFGARVFEVWG